jgi:hypothetical protein
MKEEKKKTQWQSQRNIPYPPFQTQNPQSKCSHTFVMIFILHNSLGLFQGKRVENEESQRQRDYQKSTN